MGRMGAVVKGDQPYRREEFEQNAALVETLSKLPWEAFMMPGTDKGATKMKSEALKAPAEFKDRAQHMEATDSQARQRGQERRSECLKKAVWGCG